jgi:hypothetical protein
MHCWQAVSVWADMCAYDRHPYGINCGPNSKVKQACLLAEPTPLHDFGPVMIEFVCCFRVAPLSTFHASRIEQRIASNLSCCVVHHRCRAE